MLCEYGCGEEATYQFKNGKWCCSENWRKCPQAIKDKFTKKKTYNKKMIINSTKILCEYGCGKIAKYQFKNGKYCCSQFSQQCKVNKQKNASSTKGIIPWNKGLSDCFTKEALNKIIKASKGRFLTIKQIKKKYPTFAKIEEMRYNPDKPGEKEIQVHCKNHKCSNSKELDGWFTPNKNRDQFLNRIYAIEKSKGTEGAYYYCSEECKEVCPLYNLHVNISPVKKNLYTTEEYQTWRTNVLERENYICEYCDEKATHAHHSRSQKLEPFFALDPDFGVACCEKHHYEYGHKTGTECSTGKLASKICMEVT